MEKTKRKKYLYEVAFSLLLAFVFTFVWYQSTHWTVLMGDDLIAVAGFNDLGLWGNLLNSADIMMGKIRPTQKIMLYVVYRLCGIDYQAYYVVTRIFIVAASVVAYVVARKMDINKLCSGIIVILLITCPFSAYGAWQYIGVSESFSLICCVIYGYLSYKLLYAMELKNQNKYVIVSAIWFAVLVFNAERFMYLVAVQILIILFKSSVEWRWKIGQAVIAVSPIFFRSSMLNILGSSSLGTGREDIWTLISTLIPYAIKGFVNMLGFAIGDDWHGGFVLTKLSPFVLILSSIRMFVFLGVLFDVLKRVVVERQREFVEIIVWYLFSLTSLFSYALVGATHGEDRFLWIPYVFYLFAFCRYVEKVASTDTSDSKSSGSCKYIIVGIALTGCCCLVASNYYYLKNKEHVHFRYSQEIAQTAIDSIRQLENSENVHNVAFVKPNDYSWVFYGNSFVRFYIDEDVDAYYYNSVEELNENREMLGENTIVIYPDADYEIPYGAKAYWINDFTKE